MGRAGAIKGLLSACLIIISLLLVSVASAEPASCSIVAKGSCPAGSVDILSAADSFNAHVASVSYADFAYTVCCPSSIDINDSYTIARYSDAGGGQGHLCAPSDNNCPNIVTGSWSGCDIVPRGTATGVCPVGGPSSCVVSVSSDGHVTDCSDETYGGSVLCCNEPAPLIQTCADLSASGTDLSVYDCTDSQDGPFGDGWHCDTSTGVNRCCREGAFWDNKSSCLGPTDCRYEKVTGCASDPSSTDNYKSYLSQTSTDTREACVNTEPVPFEYSCSDMGILSGKDYDGDGIEDNIHDYQNIIPVCKGDDSIDYIEFNGGGPWAFTVSCGPADGICPEDYNNDLSGSRCSLGCGTTNPDLDCGCPFGYSSFNGACVSCSVSESSVSSGSSVDISLDVNSGSPGFCTLDFGDGSSSSVDCSSSGSFTHTYSSFGTDIYYPSFTDDTSGDVINCGSVNVTAVSEICDNGLDDDGDGLIDYSDTDDCTCPPDFPYRFGDTCASCSASPLSVLLSSFPCSAWERPTGTLCVPCAGGPFRASCHTSGIDPSTGSG
jgi:hypothetical protein